MSSLFTSSIQSKILRLDLAARLAPPFGDLTKRRLQAVCECAIEIIEEQNQITLAPSVKQRVWDQVCDQLLEKFDFWYLCLIKDRILGKIKTKDVKAMLDEHKALNSIQSKEHCHKLRQAFKKHASSINEEVINLAAKMGCQFGQLILFEYAKENK